jgi:transcription initiation factor TFIIIB Brf1 subunit/transcription initiation factor TFIIB
MQNSIVCSTCKKDQTIITDEVTGEIVCSKCGLVISDKIQDTRQEWRDFIDAGYTSDIYKDVNFARHYGLDIIMS